MDLTILKRRLLAVQRDDTQSHQSLAERRARLVFEIYGVRVKNR
jgi:hypothetical protein